MKLSQLVKKYRQENKLTMQQFADKVGFSKGYISMVENEYNPQSGKPISPSLEAYKAFAKGLDIDVDDLIKIVDPNSTVYINKQESKGIKIPVLGDVAAGVPIEAIEDIIDYEEISRQMASTGDFFALQIKGDSMSPRICNKDVVIVKQQSDVNSGDIAIVLVNGDSATCKKVIKKDKGIMLMPFNNEFEPMFFDNKQVQELPVVIVGKVVELRGKF